LEWCLTAKHKGGPGAQYFKRLATAAVRHNHLPILRWLHEQHLEFDLLSLVRGAAETNNSAMIEFVKSLMLEGDYEGTFLRFDLFSPISSFCIL
jgi:hypothetical protein